MAGASCAMTLAREAEEEEGIAEDDSNKKNRTSTVVELLEAGSIADVHGSSYGDSRMYR